MSLFSDELIGRLRKLGGITRKASTLGGRRTTDRLTALTKIGQAVNIPAIQTSYEAGKSAFNYGKELAGKLPGECRENPFSPECVQKSYDTYTPDVEQIYQKAHALGSQWAERDGGLRSKLGKFITSEKTQSALNLGGEFIQSEPVKKIISKVGGSLFRRLFGKK